MTAPSYTGRFAPSPSGPLHAGSLLTAVASYVDARANGGRWLVRMEDLDPPREMPGADALILQTLVQHGLLWDGDVLCQSTRHDRYRDVLAALEARQLTYRCACSRQRLAESGHRYDGYCRLHPPPENVPCAIRLKVSDLPPAETVTALVDFEDRLQGRVSAALPADSGDFVIHRKDGLFAYALAVVVDDIDQGVTDIVRGSDILEATARQIFLTRLLGAKPPRYAHIPVLLGGDGQKLSKQNHAPAVDLHTPSANLWNALQRLGQSPSPELVTATPAAVLAWAIEHWQPNLIPRQASLPG